MLFDGTGELGAAKPSLLWAEAKRGTVRDINESFVQLILTAGKARTLDKADVDVMRDRVANGWNMFEDHTFQFDFLNDGFDRLPDGLREIVADERGRMNNDSTDEHYAELIADLRAKQKLLAKRIEAGVYAYGFLK